MPRHRPAGGEAVLVSFWHIIRCDIHHLVAAVGGCLEASEYPSVRPDWLVEVVPAYSSLLVRYKPERIRYADLVQRLQQLTEDTGQGHRISPRRIEIPVIYGGADGPDLKFVAKYVDMTTDEVIEIHSRPVYTVYMLGFTPGFCYLGDLPPRLAVPRRETPRLHLPAGAVAIGGAQTGVYSLDNSPGGWRWIGRTNTALWD